MKKYIYQHTFKKSPWEDSEPKENIFTKKRRDQFNFDNFQFNFNPKLVIWILGGIILLWLALLVCLIYSETILNEIRTCTVPNWQD